MESSTGLRSTSCSTKLLLFGSGLRVRQVPRRSYSCTSKSVSLVLRAPSTSRPTSRPTSMIRLHSFSHAVHGSAEDYGSTRPPTQGEEYSHSAREDKGEDEKKNWKSFLQRDTSDLKGDLFGGFTAAVVALPLALAFGVASGAGPTAGLYGAIFSGFFAALFGGTPAQVTGPTGPMTVVAATVFAQFKSSNVMLAFSVICLAGIFQVIMGAMKLGRFIKLVPAPVISGFMSGIGCIILSTQLLPLCGLHAAPNALNAVQSIPTIYTNLNFHAFFIGILSFALCLFTPQKITKIVPGSLLALVFGTTLSLTAGLNVPILGAMPSQLPTPVLLQFPVNQLPIMMKSALILALLGTIDSLLTSLVADNLTETYHDSNQEMIGQGIGNTISGLFGGIPGAGATMRTVVNIRSGGKTRLSGMFHSMLLFTIIMGAGGIAQSIPHAVLAGILMKTGWDIIDRRFIYRLTKLPPATGLVMWTVLLMTVFVDLIVAVGAGCILASMLLINEMSNSEVMHCSVITSTPPSSSLNKENLTSSSSSSSASLMMMKSGLTDTETSLIESTAGQLGLIMMRGSFTFSSANGILRKVTNAISSLQGVVMDLSQVGILDGDAILTIEQLLQKAKNENKLFLISGASHEMNLSMQKLEIDLPLLPTTDRTEALYSAQQQILKSQDEEMTTTVHKTMNLASSTAAADDVDTTVKLASNLWTPSPSQSPLDDAKQTSEENETKK